MRVIWTAGAAASRRAAIAHIAEHDIRAARNQLFKVMTQADRLAERPELGRPGRQPGTRFLSIARTPFLVAYRIRPRAQRIEVFRFIHTRQNWQG